MTSMTRDLDDGELIDIYGRPYDRWVVSHTAFSARRYLTHLAAPRFIAKITADARSTDIGGLTIYEGGMTFYDIVFLDEAPADPNTIRTLFSAAVTALERFPQR